MPLHSSLEYFAKMGLAPYITHITHGNGRVGAFKLQSNGYPLLTMTNRAKKTAPLKFLQFEPLLPKSAATCCQRGEFLGVAHCLPTVSMLCGQQLPLAQPKLSLISATNQFYPINIPASKHWLFRRFLRPLRWLFANKKIVGMMGAALPMLYAAVSWQSSNDRSFASATPVMATYEQIVDQQQLRLATVNNTTTYFADQSLAHGFGYDVLRRYADHLKVGMTTLVYDNEQQALAAVTAGQADMALTTMPHTNFAANDEMVAASLTCEQDYLSEHGLNQSVSLQFNGNDKQLTADIHQFLCSPEALKTHQHLAAFYNQTLLTQAFSQQHFAQTVTEVLPRYEASFKDMALQYNLDWELLVAMGYQESHLDANAVSPTGVKGLMMLTSSTADAMGVTNRTDAKQSILGGAKYINLLQAQFSHVPKSDRIWFTLAAYNMGPQAVKNVQQILQKRGRNPNSWAQVYQYLSSHRATNSRYQQCIDYVTHIRSYLEALKVQRIGSRQVA